VTKPTEDFRKELDAALRGLVEQPTAHDAISDQCPEPESIMAHARGQHVDPEVGAHLGSCSNCSELAVLAKRQQKVYERQRHAFELAASQKPSFAQYVNEAFQPLAWLRRPIWAVSAAAVLIAIAGTGAWQQYQTTVLTQYAAHEGHTLPQLLTIEASDPQKPESTESSLRDILQQTRQGKQVDSVQIRKLRFVIDQKQTAVADNPSLAGQWRNIDNQLAVVEWWNRYSELQKKAEGNAPSHRFAASLSSEINGSEDTGTVVLDWDPSRNGKDLALLKDSLSQTAGLDKMTIITPENKRLTLANTDKSADPSRNPATPH
jgi:hypothetical protein